MLWATDIFILNTTHVTYRIPTMSSYKEEINENSMKRSGKPVFDELCPQRYTLHTVQNVLITDNYFCNINNALFPWISSEVKGLIEGALNNKLTTKKETE